MPNHIMLFQVLLSCLELGWAAESALGQAAGSHDHLTKGTCGGGDHAADLEVTKGPAHPKSSKPSCCLPQASSVLLKALSAAQQAVEEARAGQQCGSKDPRVRAAAYGSRHIDLDKPHEQPPQSREFNSCTPEPLSVL